MSLVPCSSTENRAIATVARRLLQPPKQTPKGCIVSSMLSATDECLPAQAQVKVQPKSGATKHGFHREKEEEKKYKERKKK